MAACQAYVNRLAFLGGQNIVHRGIALNSAVDVGAVGARFKGNSSVRMSWSAKLLLASAQVNRVNTIAGKQ